SGSATVRMLLAQPGQEPVTNGDEHTASGLANRRTIDLDPRQTQLEGLGVIHFVRNDDLDRSDRQVGGTEEGNIDDVPGAKAPFLRRPEYFSRHLLRGLRFAASLSTASTERDRSAPAPPILHGLGDESLRREMDDPLGAARRPPVMVVPSLHLSRVEIDDGLARRAGVSRAAAGPFGGHEAPAFVAGHRYSEPIARGHVCRYRTRLHCEGGHWRTGPSMGLPGTRMKSTFPAGGEI